MTFLRAFIGFDGRIGRLTFWLATLVLISLGIFLYIAALDALTGGRCYDKDFGSTLRETRQIAIASLVVFGVLVCPSLAITIKRLHDQDRSAWWSALFFAPEILVIETDILGITGPTNNPNFLGTALFWVNWAVCILYLLDLGFRDGTIGPNRYGPDPSPLRRNATNDITFYAIAPLCGPRCLSVDK